MYNLSSSNSQSWLSWFLRGLLTLGFLILITRLVDLQIIRGSYYRSLSEDNRIRRVTIQAPRGQILARGGEVLVGNRDIVKTVEFDKTEGFVKKDTTDASQENSIVEPVRHYLLGDAFGHGSGYVGKVNKDELGKIEGECPEKGAKQIGDYTGRSGLEKYYDCSLYGANGELLFEVDAKHETVRILGKKNPVPGDDIKTTIDIGMQKTVHEVMLGRPGAVIVADPNGEVLAFYSSPSFDPNLFISGNPNQLASILNDKALPLFDRAIGGLFHPGSVFKPFVASAALQVGAINSDFSFEDNGEIVIKNIYGTYSYKNWYFTQYGQVEGKIGITQAIARSTDTFFYKVGELLGPVKLNEWANNFGLNSLTGIDVPGEISGLVPSPNWKLDFKGERWFLGDTYNMAIGQGDLAVTPIEINTAISTIANGGKSCKPHFLQLESSDCKEINIDRKYIDLVVSGMTKACESGGTAYPFFDFFDKTGIRVACKTGTAQNVSEDPHAWFTAFGPVQKPEIVVTVLIENGGEGSKVAAPIARKIFDYYFKAPQASSPSPKN